MSKLPKLVASEMASSAAAVTEDARPTVKFVVVATSPKPNPNMPSSSIVPPVISFSTSNEKIRLV